MTTICSRKPFRLGKTPRRSEFRAEHRGLNADEWFTAKTRSALSGEQHNRTNLAASIDNERGVVCNDSVGGARNHLIDLASSPKMSGYDRDDW